jgi:hypothetical protein
MLRSHDWTPPQGPSSHHRPAERRRRRRGIALGAAAVAVTLACTLAPVTAAHAEALLPHSGDAAPPGLSLGGFIGNLVQQLDEAGAFEEAEELEDTGGQSVSSSGSVTRVSLSEAWVAQVAKPDRAGRPVLDASACAWVLKTRLEAAYDPSSRALRRVTGSPDASLNCGGTFGLPLRQDGTLQHTLNGEDTTTVAGQNCRNDTGCRSTNVTGSYDCAGGACAGTHQLTLRHIWTLPSPYVWSTPPRHCEVIDGGATLRCVTRSKTVVIPETRGGVTIASANPADRTTAA